MAKATKEQIERDLRISRPAKPSKTKGEGRAAYMKLAIQEYAATVFALLYILSALVGGASLLDIINAPEQLNTIVASLLIAYAAVAFVQFVHRGVKQQIAERNSQKEG